MDCVYDVLKIPFLVFCFWRWEWILCLRLQSRPSPLSSYFLHQLTKCSFLHQQHRAITTTKTWILRWRIMKISHTLNWPAITFSQAQQSISNPLSELSNFLDIFFSVISKTEWTNKKVFESPFLQQATQTIFSTNIADGGQNQLFNILLFERKIKSNTKRKRESARKLLTAHLTLPFTDPWSN